MAQKDLRKFLDENKFTVTSNEIKNYKEGLKEYLARINAAITKNETEEHLKGILREFLKTNFYFETKYTINTSSAIDAAISKDNKLQVLIETKKPSNVQEMISPANLNKKALWEIILYYIEATRKIIDGKVKRNPDSEIKNIVITDCKKFFIFDSQEIEFIVKGELEKFWEKKENNQLISSNKDIFYDKVKDFFAQKENLANLDYIYFDIEELYKTRSGIVSSYKILSKQILLKDKVAKVTASPLNSAFYQELLYILGLKEVKENGKLVIKINFDVANTFAVQVYKYLKEDKGIINEDEVIDKTFSAIIVWTNRLLFIKLFEGQLLAINGDRQEYRILDKDKIQSENDLQNLFFRILGTKERENGEFFDKFKDVPYLNSSLFENYDVERNDIMIRDIDNKEVEVKNHSKTNKKGKLKLVEYVIDFLNSYSFSSVYSGDGEVANGKEIIDAAVLGLIFEKINGYKDGSYYTPSSITEYICKETIESTVIQKVNEFYNHNLKTFDDLILFSSDLSKKRQINDIINSIRICDPAVGSGHFLVSALNRIIAIKSELGVLFYYNENRLLNDYDVRVSNDVLTISDGNGEAFTYNRANVNSLKVQKTIFWEKRLIIENCLFGVDINDKAVSICQLRLWIELLKNAYYENNVMETLPNIDINIKCGNSLVHKLPVEVGRKLSDNSDKELKKLIADYRQKVKSYKQESNKMNKQQIKSAIVNLKKSLHRSFVQLSFLTEDNADYEELGLMKNAFEWAIEFPEVLADDGAFLGFDCVIGNPPYFNVQTFGAKHPIVSFLMKRYSEIWMDKSDILFFFIYLGYLLTKNQVCYITSNAYLFSDKAKRLRNFIISKLPIHQIENFENYMVFDSASITSCISHFKKKNNLSGCISVNAKVLKGNEIDLKTALYNDNLFFNVKLYQNKNFSLIQENLQNLDRKIKSNYPTLGTLLKVGKGMETAANSVFLFDRKPDFPDKYIKKRIAGDMISKYIVGKEKQYLLYYEDVNDFDELDDCVKKHLYENKGFLENRATVKYEGRLWWKYSRPMHKEYYKFDKIWCSYRATNNCFGLDTTREFIGFTNTTVIFASNKDYDIRFILAIVNSKLLEYYHKTNNKQTGGGVFEYFPNTVDKYPIPKITLQEQGKFIEIIDKILAQKAINSQCDTSSFEKEIDELIYELYGLTEEEIVFIESMIKPME